MEFPNLGRQCKVCKQLDFLPFQCDGCQDWYCQDHRKYNDHRCNKAPIEDVRCAPCPLCNKVLAVGKDGNLNAKIDLHIQNGCDKEASKQLRKQRQCSHTRCKAINLVPVFCKDCGNNYCLKHRLPLDHECAHVSLEKRLARLQSPIIVN